jgi:NADH-quinone oxidoreductase subunit L
MVLSAYGRFVKMKILLDEEAIRKSSLIRILYNKYYIDELYDFLFVRPCLWLSRVFHIMIELKFIDRIVNLVGNIVIRTGYAVRYMQTGHVGFYLFMMIMGIILILVLNILVF